MKNSTKEAELITKFSSNGWVDWICTSCNKIIYNDNVHVTLDWGYCPYCGKKFKEES